MNARRDEYEREIESIQQTAGMLRIMDALRYRVFSFGRYGPEYVDIGIFSDERLTQLCGVLATKNRW